MTACCSAAAWPSASASRSGDPITLISPQGTATAFGTVPRIKTYTVAGTFDVGMYEFDNGVIFMPLDAAQTFFNLGKASRASRSWSQNPDDVQRYDREIAQALGRPRQRLRLAAEQSLLLQRRRGRAQRHVPDPDADHPGRRVQHHLQHDHAGEGQGPRHRHPAHHGRDARHDSAHLHAVRRQRRRRRHDRGLRPRRAHSPTISKRSASSCRASSAPSSSPPRSIS